MFPSRKHKIFRRIKTRMVASSIRWNLVPVVSPVGCCWVVVLRIRITPMNQHHTIPYLLRGIASTFIPWKRLPSDIKVTWLAHIQQISTQNAHITDRHTHTHVCMYVYIYVCMYRERERERISNHSLQISILASNENFHIIPKYGLFLLSGSNRDTSQQCDHMHSYKIPEWESSSSQYDSEIRE